MKILFFKRKIFKNLSNPTIHYDNLELSISATRKQIKQNYMRLAIKYHPDTTDDPNSTSKFHELNNSYKLLMDPSSKREYDKYIMEKSNQKLNNSRASHYRHQSFVYFDSKAWEYANIRKKFNNKSSIDLKAKLNYNFYEWKDRPSTTSTSHMEEVLNAKRKRDLILHDRGKFIFVVAFTFFSMLLTGNVI
jgi:DnaJ-class molecular chaperone